MESDRYKTRHMGKCLVFSYQAQWEGRFYEEKAVTVYYKIITERLLLLTVKARYGKDFPRGERQ